MKLTRCFHSGIVGKYQYQNFSKGSIYFFEWFSGEGLDLKFHNSDTNEERSISLNINELQALASICEALGYLNLDEVKNEAKELKKNSKERKEFIEQRKSSSF